jgi:uncharacterized membrane protein YdjX (TVP38/TMEM64 family)
VTRGKWSLAAGLATIFLVFFAFDLGRFLELEHLREIRVEALQFVNANFLAASAGYFVVYVLVTAGSLPGAAVMTLAGGALFGVGWGLLLVSFASTIGATGAFLLSRMLLRDWVQSRFRAQLEAVNGGFEREGGFYLFSLRMVPLFPFFVVNLVMGLTPMRVAPYYLISQVGMLPATAVYVFAGTQLADIESLSDVLSPGLLTALVLLGALPLIAKKTLEWSQRMRKRA